MIKNKVGNIYGRLLVESFSGLDYRGKASWLCLCTCGAKVIASADRLNKGEIISCGCYKAINREDLLGRQINHLKVIAYHKTVKAKAYWKCLCVCGDITIQRADGLKNNKIKSCGCLNNKNKGTPVIRNNQSNRDLYSYRKWRKDVFEIHDYTCKKCGQVGGKLEVHHIENYASNLDKRESLSNGLVFCKTCHSDFHKQYGKLKNNYLQVVSFIHGELFNVW